MIAERETLQDAIDHEFHAGRIDRYAYDRIAATAGLPDRTGRDAELAEPPVEADPDPPA